MQQWQQLPPSDPRAKKAYEYFENIRIKQHAKDTTLTFLDPSQERIKSGLTKSGIFTKGISPVVLKNILNGDPESLADYIISQISGWQTNNSEKKAYETGMFELEKKIHDILEKANRYALVGRSEEHTSELQSH